MSEYHSVKTKCSYLFVDSFDLVLALLNVTENLLKQCDNFYDISFHFIVQSWPMENHLVLSFPKYFCNSKQIEKLWEDILNSVFSASQLPIVISLEVSRRESRSNDWREDWHTSISALNIYLLSRFSCRYFVILYLSFPCYHRHILLFSTLIMFMYFVAKYLFA